jgi:2-dehydropantoate 2-reductase
MRILVLGAGALGGYFGGRLLQAGRNVTFLVRERRAKQLRETGLVIRSPAGEVQIAHPPLVLAHELREPFDLILLSCKAYDLETAITAIAPAVGPRTRILPMLNGLRHLEVLEAKFGKQAVLGGLCFISAALDEDGRILHFNDFHNLTFGEREGGSTPNAHAIRDELAGAGFDLALSETILQEMWEKWIFIAALAGLTCLMRASVGDVIAADGTDLGVSILNECATIATQAGFPPREAGLARGRAMMTATGSTLMASMLRDIERGAQTEGEHILGDLVRRETTRTTGHSLLRLAYTHVKAYELRSRRKPAPV